MEQHDDRAENGQQEERQRRVEGDSHQPHPPPRALVDFGRLPMRAAPARRSRARVSRSYASHSTMSTNSATRTIGIHSSSRAFGRSAGALPDPVLTPEAGAPSALRMAGSPGAIRDSST